MPALPTLLTDIAALQALAAALALIAAAVIVLWLHARARLTRAQQAAGQHVLDLTLARDRIAALEPEAAQSRALSLWRSQHEVRLEERDTRIAALTEERDGLSDALFRAREAAARLDRDLAETRLSASKDREAAARDIATLRNLREEMTGQFRLLAQETLRTQGADLQRVQSDQLAALLTPFRDQVQRFQTELQTRNKILDEEGARLRSQIETLHRRSEDISREAVELTRALKGDKQRQGAWGEMILERILEDSGLQEGTHYDRQAAYRDQDGGRWRPDVVVRMPRGKVLVIDSKVSLNAFEQSCNLPDPADRAAALKRHVQALRAHVTGLSDRGYQNLDDGSVDYVLMFIPVEGAFSEAMRADPDLTRFALDRRVGMATPTTLMLTLRTVEHIWLVEKRETNALEIAQRAGMVYDKVAGLVESLDAVGRAIDAAGRAHGLAMDRLSRGQGNVIRQVEMLRELGAKAQKKIELSHDSEPAVPPRPKPRVIGSGEP